MVSFSHSLDFPPIGCIHTLEFTATGDRSFLYLFRLLALFSWISSFLVPVCQRCPTPLRRVLLVTVCQPNFSLLVAVCRLVLDQLCVSSRSRLTFVLWICIPSPSHATKTSVSGVVTSISQELVRRLLHHSRRLQGRRHRGQGAAVPQKNWDGGGAPPPNEKTIRTVCEAMATGAHWATFSEMDKLLRLYLSVPITSATSERAFLTLRRLLTYLRSTMTEKRLNNCCLLHIHKDVVDEMSLQPTATEFIMANDERRHYFGTPQWVILTQNVYILMYPLARMDAPKHCTYTVCQLYSLHCFCQ